MLSSPDVDCKISISEITVVVTLRLRLISNLCHSGVSMSVASTPVSVRPVFSAFSTLCLSTSFLNVELSKSNPCAQGSLCPSPPSGVGL